MATALGTQYANAAPRSAAIIVDANTGKVLYESNADALCYPASLTKMMTLYLTFEAMAEGKISKDTQVRFSPYASAQAPTKLGVKPGDSVTVETAIDSIVTRSANDSAAALGEMLGGSIPNFARMMNAKARSLGMTRTTFRNANGLPDPEQKTTARDIAMLGMALRSHFPQYYSYFSTTSFMYGRRRIVGHNHLLGKVAGVDGIKTGYTRASGYNLATSVSLDGKHLVGVVLGGRTYRERDRRMVGLIRKYFSEASVRRDGKDVVAKTEAQPETPHVLAAALPHDDIPTPDKRPHRQPQPSTLALAEATESAGVKKIDEVVDPVKTASTDDERQSDSADAKGNGWVIQVASTDTKALAESYLERTAREVPHLLNDASPFTVAFKKGRNTYYRARFSGFSSKDKAWDACSVLKRKRISCYAVEQ